MHELLKKYQVTIDFLDSGCVISVGCKKFAFSLAVTGIWELHQYVLDPETMIRKWLPEEAEYILNPNELMNDLNSELMQTAVKPPEAPPEDQIIHNQQVIGKLITDFDNLMYPGGANETHWTYKKLFLLVADAACVHENNVKPESRLSEDLGLDSLDAVELVLKTEQAFNIDIPDSQAENVRTVEDLHNIVLSHILNKPENERATPISDQQ